MYEAISHFTEHTGGGRVTLQIYGPEILTLPFSPSPAVAGRYSKIGHDEIQNAILDSIVAYLTVIIFVSFYISDRLVAVAWSVYLLRYGLDDPGFKSRHRRGTFPQIVRTGCG
jgi:hypothetical protein